MIMRVTWGKIRPGLWDKYETLWKANAARSASAKGLKGRWLLLDKETADAGYSISLWDRSEDFDDYSKQVVLDKDMQDCFVGQYVTTVCDVRGAEIEMLTASQ
jgi:heme-degrading monooxygenase HmoA